MAVVMHAESSFSAAPPPRGAVLTSISPPSLPPAPTCVRPRPYGLPVCQGYLLIMPGQPTARAGGSGSFWVYMGIKLAFSVMM